MDQNNKEFSITGGARIGYINVTWPFATLKVTKEKLNLNAFIAGKCSFNYEDVVSIEAYGMIPIIGRGIKINHKISGYADFIVFWTFKRPAFVIDEIKKVGFLRNGINM